MSGLPELISFMLTPTALALMAVGTSLGILVGAIPGLTGAMLIALSLPLTFSMGGDPALVLLISMYVGSVSGGLITATLLRMPGTPASMMTTLDGYPTRQGWPTGASVGTGHRCLSCAVGSFPGSFSSCCLNQWRSGRPNSERSISFRSL